MQPALLQRGGSRLQGARCCTLLPAAARSCSISRPWLPHRQHSSSKRAQVIAAVPFEDVPAATVEVNDSADIIVAADVSAAAVTSSSGSSSSNGQIARLAYASLSAVAVGCAVFAGKALAAEQRSTTLPPPPQIHSVTSSTTSSRRSRLVPTQPLQLPFASVSQQQAPEAAAAAAVAAQPAVPLRQPHSAATAAYKHSSINAELHYRIRQVRMLLVFHSNLTLV
jgi:hypothetical protein